MTIDLELELARRKALFDAAMNSGYGMEDIGPEHAPDDPPDDGDFVPYVLEHWNEIATRLRYLAELEPAARQFHSLWWKLQKGAAGFDLHNSTVVEFERAEERVRTVLPGASEATRDKLREAK